MLVKRGFTYSLAGPIRLRSPMTSMSQLSEEQLAAGPASESACDELLEARIYL